MTIFLNALARLTAVREPLPRKWAYGLTAVALGLMLVGYASLSWHQHQINPNDTTIPDASQLWRGFVSVFEPQKRTGERWIVEDAIGDAKRFSLGLSIGVLGAVFLGMNMGAFAFVDAMFNLPFTFLSKIPPMAAFGAFFVLFGTDETLFVAVVVFAVLPTLAQSISLTVKDFPDELRYKALTLGAGRFDLVWMIIFQWALPRIIDAVRLQVGEVIKALVGAELVVGSTGFGSQIRAQMRLSNMSVVFTYVVFIVVLGYGIDRLLTAGKTFFCPQTRERSE